MANELAVNAGAVELFSLKGNEVAIDFGLHTEAMADANYTLTDTEYKNLILKFTGTLTATREVTLPTTSGAWFWVDNQTTQSLTFKTAAGSGVTVATTKRAAIYCDGTNYVRLTADA